MRDPGSISLVGRKQCCINWLHAGGAREGSHQPVIYTVQVIDVHARQKSNWVPINKVHHTDHTLPDLFFWSISSRVINSFRQMLYKAYSLSYPNLFLFSQLSCQASLARCWMIDRNWNLFLIWRRRLLIRLRPLAKAGPVGLRLVKQGDVIRSGGLEAVPHLLELGCVIWGRKKAVAGSFARSAVSLGQRGGVGRQAGVQAAAAPPAPGAAEGQLMPVPGAGGLRLGRGFPGVAAVASWGGGSGGGGRGDEALPHPAPPRGGGGHGAAGPNPGQEWGGAAVAAPSAAASAAAAGPADAGAAAAGLILLRFAAAADRKSVV